MRALADTTTPLGAHGNEKYKPPTVVLSIDQGEELFLAEAQDEAKLFLRLVKTEDEIATVTMRVTVTCHMGEVKATRVLRSWPARAPTIRRGNKEDAGHDTDHHRSTCDSATASLEFRHFDRELTNESRPSDPAR